MNQDEKKIRSLAKFFRELHKSKAVGQAVVGNTPLPPLIVEEICHHVRKDNLSYADFVALRGKPGNYDFGNPHDWLWLLHRAMNHHRAELCVAVSSDVIKSVLEDLELVRDFESDRMSSSGVEVLARSIQLLSTLL